MIFDLHLLAVIPMSPCDLVLDERVDEIRGRNDYKVICKLGNRYQPWIDACLLTERFYAFGGFSEIFLGLDDGVKGEQNKGRVRIFGFGFK